MKLNKLKGQLAKFRVQFHLGPNQCVSLQTFCLFFNHFLVESASPNSSDFNRRLDGNRVSVDGSWLRMAQNNSMISMGHKQPMEDGYV